MSNSGEIGKIIDDAIVRLRVTGKCGQRILQPAIISAINNAGFHADKEDSQVFLRPKMRVWRSKDNKEVVTTKTRRKIDIVVRSRNQPIALIEAESDLNDLKWEGVTRRNGHYDVFSIARAADGGYFNSYKSLERMAAAAFYFHLQDTLNSDVDQEVAENRIAAIRSDRSKDHNPAKIALFLVTGSCRKMDEEILRPRLLSLNAKLISASNR